MLRGPAGSPSAQTGTFEAACARRGRRFFRWTALVPCLTAAIFGGLCALTLFEIDRRRPRDPSGRRPSARDRTAEVLARYRAEAAKLGEIRERARSGLSAEGIASVFDRRAAGRDGVVPALPGRAVLLADFQALRKRSPGSVPRLLRALVPVWRRALEREDLRPGELELLGELFLQAAVSLDGPPVLEDGERRDIVALAGDLVRRGEGGMGGVIVYLGLVAEPADAGALRDLAEKVHGAQHREELRRILDRLERRGANWRVAGAR